MWVSAATIENARALRSAEPCMWNRGVERVKSPPYSVTVWAFAQFSGAQLARLRRRCPASEAFNHQHLFGFQIAGFHSVAIVTGNQMRRCSILLNQEILSLGAKSRFPRRWYDDRIMAARNQEQSARSTNPAHGQGGQPLSSTNPAQTEFSAVPIACKLL